MSALLDRRLLVVTGKGGVGRTTATAALALAAGRLGRRACAVELSGQDALARALGFEQGDYAPRRVADNVDVRSLSPTACMADFGTRKLRLPGLARWFFESRLMAGFVEAVPGLHDLVQLGKVENMLLEPLPGEPEWDLVVLDGPATGHGLTLLAAARAMREMTVTGPFHELAAIIERLLEDTAATGTVLITLPEALPVNEGLQLIEALAVEHAPPAAVLVNQVGRPWPGAVPPETILSALEPPGDAPPALRVTREALHELAAAELARQARQAQALTDLAARLPEAAGRHVEVHRLPELDDPHHLDPLVDALVEVLG